MRRKHGNRCALRRARPDALAAVAPVLGGLHELALRIVEVARRPSVVGDALHAQQLFRRQVRALLQPVQLVAYDVAGVGVRTRRVRGSYVVSSDRD